jgi:hypothetical protein
MEPTPIDKAHLALGIKMFRRTQRDPDNSMKRNSWRAWLAVNGDKLIVFAAHCFESHEK